MPEDVRDEFYVGYLPPGPSHRRFVRLLVPLCLWAICGVAAVWARSQQSPGTGVWDQGQPVHVRGTLMAKPYPMLITSSETGRPEALLLVEMGKIGAASRAAPLDGRVVTASGWMLHRDGRRMLELESGDAALVAENGQQSDIPKAAALGHVTLRGEIVDSKCFLGAMKPGEGKTHKECATLCIRGGVPPMLVSFDAQGRTVYTLLSGPGDAPLPSAVLPFVGDVIEISGEMSERADVRVLQVTPETVRRL